MADALRDGSEREREVVHTPGDVVGDSMAVHLGRVTNDDGLQELSQGKSGSTTPIAHTSF